MSLHYSTVYVRDASLGRVRSALEELMAETERLPVRDRGLEPTPDDEPAAKKIRSFAILPVEDGWLAVLEDGHPVTDGGVAEGLSDILKAEVMHFAYSDHGSFWSFELYWEGQPLEAGGAEDEDFDVSAMEFIAARSLPHFGVYYEEVAAAAPDVQPALAGALSFVGDIVPRVPMGTEIVTFRRAGAKRSD